MLSNAVCAQNKIQGRVADSQTKQGIEFVTIALYKPDTSLVKGNITDQNGTFLLENLSKGHYILITSMIGYESDSTELTLLNDSCISLEIELKEHMIALGEVEVSAIRNPVKQKADRLSIDIANYTTTNEKNAFDVLEVLPGVINDGSQLNVMGKSAIIYINGRPIQLSGKEMESYLKSIPGSNIKTVELITNPSAKYDADISGSIIDIRLKNKDTEGLNGRGTMGLSIKNTGWVYEPSLSLNYRKNKLNIYSNYGLLSGKYENKVNHLRKYNSSPVTVFDDNEKKEQDATINSLMFGVDYFANDKHTLGLIINGNTYNIDDQSLINTGIMTNTENNPLDSSIVSTLGRDMESQFLSTNINHKWITDTTGSFLNTDITFSYINNEGKQMMKSEYYDKLHNLQRPTSGFSQNANQQTNIFTFRTDYNKKISQGLIFEAGIKATFTQRSNEQDYGLFDQGEWKPDKIQSNVLNYDEDILASYISFNKKWKNWSAIVAVRAEQTYYEGQNSNDETTFKNNYFNLFPSVYLMRNLSKGGNITTSYSYKITRPSFHMLNPFRYYNGYNIYQEGNPDLKPYYRHSFDLKYYSHKGFSMTLTHSAYKNQILNEPYQNDQTGELTYTYFNFGSTKETQFVLYMPYRLFKWWNFKFTGRARFVEYNSFFMGNDYYANDISGYFSLLNSFSLAKNFKGEFYINHSTSRRFVATDIDDRTYMRFTLSKSFWDNKGTLALSYLNPFRLADFSSSLQYENIDLKTLEISDQTMLKISFSYNFGSDKIKRKRSRNTGAEDIEERAM